MSDFFVHESSFVDQGVEIGSGTKIWHFCHVSKDAQIGKNCSLGQNVYVGPGVKIGDGVKIQNNVSVYEGVELEDYVFCGPSMVFTNVIKPRSKFPKQSPDSFNLTKVKYGATIGANATIVCGTTVGAWSFIGAGTVVTKEVQDYAMMVGVPARQIGYTCQCGERLPEATKEVIQCTACNKSYVKANGQLIINED